MLPSRPNAHGRSPNLSSFQRAQSATRPSEIRNHHLADSLPPPVPAASRYQRQRSMTALRHHQPSIDHNKDGVLSHTPRRTPHSLASSRSSSGSSASSFPSIFTDKSHRGESGYSSSRTSFEEEPSPQNEEGEELDKQPATTEGFSVWGRVANLASNLTVNVSKAWTTNVATISGEDTPPGSESRLIRAMKAYHIERANDPSELPEWLFSERERFPAKAPSKLGGRREEVEQKVLENAPARERPPLLSSQRSHGTSAQAVPSWSTSTRTPLDQNGNPSRASERLRALHSAKRGAVRDEYQTRPQEEEREAYVKNSPSARVGLPTNPGLRARRI